MKRAALGLIVLLAASVAQAGGRWQYCGRGVYQGDTYYWHATCVCGCWQYQKLCPVANCPAPGTPDFWTRMAELNVRADELQNEADYVKSRWPGRYRAADTQTTGYSVTQQGYQANVVQGGTSIVSTGPSYQPVDINAIVHEAQRNQELAGLNSQTANAQVNAIVSNAVEGNSAYARILAGGQVAAAMIAAAAPPVTTTTAFRTSTIAAGQPTQPAAVYQSQALVTRQAGDPTLILSRQLLVANCSACHNQNKASHNLDLTVDPSTLGPFRKAIEDALISGKMPKDHPRLEEAVINAILAGIPRPSQLPAQPAPPQPTQLPAQPVPPQPTQLPAEPTPPLSSDPPPAPTQN